MPAIVDHDCLPPEPRCPLPRHHHLGSGQGAAGLPAPPCRSSWCLKVGKKGARLAERQYGLCLQPALEEREMKQVRRAGLVAT
ncbi:unnamed protein product [Boreogadus saida]